MASSELKRVLVALALLLAFSLLAGAGEREAGRGGASGPGPANWAPVFQKGMSYVSWWHDEYAYARARQALIELRATHAEYIALLVTEYMDSLATTVIAAHPQRTPTTASLAAAVANARAVGMRVMLKPHIDLLTDNWRGEIRYSNEADWQAWFASYRRFILRYARFAEANGIGLLCIGTELKGTSGRAADWRAVVAEVRQAYDGRIVYAANWDEFESVAWWDALDYVGVDAYFPLTSLTSPTLAQLTAGWQRHITKLEALYARFHKPIVFTEIGYRSVDGANIWPWDWGRSAPIDLQEQADCYEAAFRVLWDKPWFFGMYWWAWSTSPNQGGPLDGDYTPHGKPAEAVLTDWYGRRGASAGGWEAYR
jgi:hypothetical protein